MDKRTWILVLLGAGGLGLFLRSKENRQFVGELASNPGIFGAGAGVAHGLLATVRGKPISLTATVITAAVIGISEGLLAHGPGKPLETAFQTGLGLAAGLAPFTRFNASERALIEARSVPKP